MNVYVGDQEISRICLSKGQGSVNGISECWEGGMGTDLAGT